MADLESLTDNSLTERQRREVDYHKEHAALLEANLRPLDYDVITSSARRWWNHYWDIWTFLISLQLEGKKVLVVGCGAGEDALRFAKLGAVVSAFDLSADMLALGIRRAEQEGISSVTFAKMPSEKQEYPDDTFDLIFARDILHHVEIPSTMTEIIRVSKLGALFVADEIYSHSVTNLVRHSWLVRRALYPIMYRFVYQSQKPYITEDERKMNEKDIAQVKDNLSEIRFQKYFNFIVTRLLPDRFPLLSKIDRILLRALGSWGHFVAGRIVIAGQIRKG